MLSLTSSILLLAINLLYGISAYVAAHNQAQPGEYHHTGLVSELRNRVGRGVQGSHSLHSQKVQEGRVINVAQDYGVDASGRTDASVQIQQAINDAWAAGMK